MLKLIAAVVLAAASTLALAAPSYEVTIRGEAPVRVTADNAGIAEASSKEQAFNGPAAGVALLASGAEHNELRVALHLNEAVIKTFTSTDGHNSRLQIPQVDSVAFDKTYKLPVGQELKIEDPRCPAGKGKVVVKITRIE